MPEKPTLRAKFLTLKSIPRSKLTPHIDIPQGIQMLKDVGLTPSILHPMASISDLGKSPLRFAGVQTWTAQHKLTFLKRSGLLPAALEMERKAFRKALQIKKLDGPKDRDIRYIQRQKNRPKGLTAPKISGEESARLIEQLQLVRARPVSVYRLRPVHSKDELAPSHISTREKNFNKSFTDRARQKLETLESKCDSLMSPERTNTQNSISHSPTEEYIKKRNPLKVKLQHFLHKKIIRTAQIMQK